MLKHIFTYKISSFFLIIGFLGLLFSFNWNDIFAQSTMRNDFFIIRMGNLNSGAGKSSGSSYQLGQTIGQTAPGLYSGSNYKVRSGFQYIHFTVPFTFSLSNLSINFGTLSPGEPITRTSTLTVTNGSANGYQVVAYENHPLKVISSGAVIPDTTCDNGSCTQSTASEWSSPLTYGFGYRCDNVSGTDCATDFSTANYYKQFANLENNETPVSVMQGVNVARDIQTTITYKANVSSSQAPGLYQNAITYIATPNF